MRALLLDIEGTTTPITFVHDVLFPYSRNNLKLYLNQRIDSPDVVADLERLTEERKHDFSNGLQPPVLIEPYVNWLIDQDRKSPALKSIQGKIWEQGYKDGTLQAPVFPDVPIAMRHWRESGLGISIFSSGSVLAQQLLFAHTDAGDLSDLIGGYFDTAMGKKNDPQSYRKIAAALALPLNEVHFVSDVLAELNAAHHAGMKTSLCVRPQNPPQESQSQHPIIHSLAEIE